MAKRRGRPPTKKSDTEPQKAKPSEERGSFLPNGDEPPVSQQPATEIHVNVGGDLDLLETAKGVNLTIRRGVDRRLEIELVIPPLSAWVEKAIWPMPGTAPEHLAGMIAAAIERAAHTLAHDAAVQYAKRISEEAAAKERFAKRA